MMQMVHFLWPKARKMTAKKHALSVTRDEDFSAWYQAVIIGASIAENSSVRGCMVIKPFGFAIWERMQSILDSKFKELGHSNCYFPLLIPVDLFEREAEHVAGFAKEMAIVTHHRIEYKDGKFIPSSPLETPLAIRPTSELIIGESMSRWVNSYRDLPILINQWCNVIRWEMRTRMFLRTSEFLWQEGHTAHETEEEARLEAKTMHDVYQWFIEDVLKMYCIPGEKPEHDRFAGAVKTLTIEAMMQDGKSLQMATSHYLGNNFAKAVNIQFQGRDGSLHYAHTTSWGSTTRMIGGLIMAHADDDGLNLPSQVAPYHVTIIPILKGISQDGEIIEYCHEIKQSIQKDSRVFVDLKEIPAQNKKWDYVRKGIPFICEIGINELQNKTVFFTRRANELEKVRMSLEEFAASIGEFIREHDEILKRKNALSCSQKMIYGIKTFEELKDFFSQSSGFVMAKWSGSKENLEQIDELAISIRCLPREQSGDLGKCILTGKDATIDIVLAKSY
ncbi:MAG: proline--tRNA ligase [Holosporales bacterium]|jgi:prolyl-tRNA synthetase|nr:proline--tRNA ligase [Holosporales bacterium]